MHLAHLLMHRLPLLNEFVQYGRSRVDRGVGVAAGVLCLFTTRSSLAVSGFHFRHHLLVHLHHLLHVRLGPFAPCCALPLQWAFEVWIGSLRSRLRLAELLIIGASNIPSAQQSVF
jgi:hypothetical protein